jgi:lysozyme family protein
MDYIELYRQLVIQPAQIVEVTQIANRIRREARYVRVQLKTSVNAELIGALHNLESGGDFSKHLHNGDSLKARTVRVPSGRPPDGLPPFNWITSAIDALKYDKVSSSPDRAEQCKAAILFNGTGYEKIGIASPYGFAGSQLYTRGKYVADGVYSPTSVSKQIGACVILKRIDQLEEEERLAPVSNLTPHETPVKAVENTNTPGIAEAPPKMNPGTLTSPKKPFTQTNPNQKISTWFTVGEFNKNGAREFINQQHFDACQRLANALDDVRENYGRPITITSGIRTLEQNRAAGGSSNSQHLTTNLSCAADIIVKGVSSRKVFRDYYGTWMGGLGGYSNGTTHFDLGENRRWDWAGAFGLPKTEEDLSNFARVKGTKVVIRLESFLGDVLIANEPHS